MGWLAETRILYAACLQPASGSCGGSCRFIGCCLHLKGQQCSPAAISCMKLAVVDVVLTRELAKARSKATIEFALIPASSSA